MDGIIIIFIIIDVQPTPSACIATSASWQFVRSVERSLATIIITTIIATTLNSIIVHSTIPFLMYGF